MPPGSDSPKVSATFRSKQAVCLPLVGSRDRQLIHRCEPPEGEGEEEVKSLESELGKKGRKALITRGT